MATAGYVPTPFRNPTEALTFLVRFGPGVFEHSVFLFLENGVVVGREGTTAVTAAGGLQVFTVEVDAATGTVTLTQLRAVHQDSPDTTNDISEGALTSMTR